MKLNLHLKKEENLSCGIFMPTYLLEEFIVKMLIVFQKQDYKVVLMRLLDLILQNTIERIVET